MRSPERKLRPSRNDIGLPPGSLVYPGVPDGRSATVTCFSYSTDSFSETPVDIDAIKRPDDGEGVVWYSVIGLWNTELLAKIGEEFSIHPLVMEDIVNLDHRSKYEIYDGYVFVTVKALEVVVGDEFDVEAEQVSILFGRDFVLSFQERAGNAFESVSDRLRNGVGRVRKTGPDYLAYALIDSVVDYYFVLLELLGDEIEAVEERIYSIRSDQMMRQLHRIKREILDIRRVVWPMRDVANQLYRDESDLITNETRTYLRDLYDHTIQVIDTVESYRDMATSLVDLSMSVTSNRMNEVMKVLTIIATIFIPLTFVAGVYGMNFNPAAGKLSMPELNHPLGYVIVLGVMLIIAFGMVIFFKRKKWL